MNQDDKYKMAFEELEQGFKSDLEYYKRGEMMSMAESVQGESRTEEVIKQIALIKKKYKI